MRLRRPGFTLIEAVLVLALVSILVLAGAASASRSAARFELERAVWEIKMRLNQARIRSVWEGVPTRLRIERAGFSLETYDEDTKTWKSIESGRWEGVTVEANNTPVYHPTGSVTGMATILVSNARGAYKITLAITGRIKATKL
ncbi:MAG TPA: prepilin-type N-terminal cleavage/methylation domain-containing protein [Acidobacteriota bacterium]|nr:prepilin-type N-terminal cleavage/methylation domain-containing protein [Acidobacteriota bacterium]